MISSHPRTALLVAVYLFASVCVLVASGSVCSAGDVKAGRAKALMCQACHGLDGLSKTPDAPNIAGQTEPYLVAQLQAYKSGCAKERRDVGGRTVPVRQGHRGSCGLFFGDRDQGRQDPGRIGGASLQAYPPASYFYRIQFSNSCRVRTQLRDLAAHPREFCRNVPPSEFRGRRECRAPDAPAAARVVVVKARALVTTVTPEIARHSPRNGFNGFLRALPGDRACLPPSPAKLPLANLTPASRRQDHTTSPSASRRPRLWRRPRPPHPAPRP